MSETAMVTLSGRLFDFASPDPFAIQIEEIAFALSRENRFTNHIHKFHSVAAHSLAVADLLPWEFKLQGLLHDAHEAYTGDINRPLGILLGSALTAVKRRLDAVIFERFEVCVTPESTAAVKLVDDLVQAIEFRDLKVNGEKWAVIQGLPTPPADRKTVLMTQGEAEAAFLRAFREYSR